MLNASYTSLVESVARISIFLLFSVVVLRYAVSDWSDWYRCGALLSRGSWAPGDTLSRGRAAFEKWEPDGCRMHEYSRNETRDCLAGRGLVFAGDSTTRQIFWAAARRLDRKKTKAEYLDLFTSEDPQRDVSFVVEGVALEFIWDPWLNSTGLVDRLRRSYGGISTADLDRPRESGGEPPALLVLGAPGLFAARHGADEYLDIFKHNMNGIWPYMLDQSFSSATTPPKGYRELVSHVLLAPVPIPAYAQLSPERQATLTPERLESMNGYLSRLPGPVSFRVIWAYNRMTDGVRLALDEHGLHVNEGVADRKVDVVLNIGCNAGLASRTTVAPRPTCCVAYPRLSVTQWGILLATTTALPVLRWVSEKRRRYRPARYLPARPALAASSVLLCCSWYCYVADRTHVFAQAEKHFNEFALAALWAGSFTLSICSLRRHVDDADAIDEEAGVVASPVAAASAEYPDGEAIRSKGLRAAQGDAGFLCRQQTDEWKGLMQMGLLLIHFQQTSGFPSLHKVTHLFAASYIFLSTYGHTMYFLRTGDYSTRRVASVLFRLNATSLLLSLVLKSEWTVYSFPRLVSFWFLAVLVTLRAFPDLNKDPARLLVKTVAFAIVINTLLALPGIIEASSAVLGLLGPGLYDAEKVRHHMEADRFIPYLGIFTAGIVHRATALRPRHEAAARPRPTNLADRALVTVVFPGRFTAAVAWTIAATSVIGLLLSLYAMLISPGYGDGAVAYDGDHPYLSCAAILAYVAVRNSHRALRDVHMVFPVPLGRMALESYLLHHHVWLAGDGAGVLTTGMWDGRGVGRGSWFYPVGSGFEAVLITSAFLCLSWLVHEATRCLSTALFGKQSEKKEEAPATRDAYYHFYYNSLQLGEDWRER